MVPACKYPPAAPYRTFSFFDATLCLLPTALFSASCRLFGVFSPLFARAILCFQHLTNSFAEIPGGGVFPRVGFAMVYPTFSRKHSASVECLATSMSRLFKVFVVAPSICYALPAKTLRHQARKFLLSPEVLSRTGP